MQGREKGVRTGENSEANNLLTSSESALVTVSSESPCNIRRGALQIRGLGFRVWGLGIYGMVRGALQTGT